MILIVGDYSDQPFNRLWDCTKYLQHDSYSSMLPLWEVTVDHPDVPRVVFEEWAAKPFRVRYGVATEETTMVETCRDALIILRDQQC